jgi:hypothetical protein
MINLFEIIYYLMNIQKFTALKKFINKQIKLSLLYIGLLFCISPAVAQLKHDAIHHDFNKELTEANLSFTLPVGFKEIKAVNNEELPFDYGIELPGADFEIWFQVISLKVKTDIKTDKDKVNNPDSLYVEMGSAQAIALMGDKNYLTRSIPDYSLANYNADEGKTYLLNLPDMATTKHYKFAMIVALQKNHTGTLLALCLANELGPDFFKNLKMASSCIKFNP